MFCIVRGKRGRKSNESGGQEISYLLVKGERRVTARESRKMKSGGKKNGKKKKKIESQQNRFQKPATAKRLGSVCGERWRGQAKRFPLWKFKHPCGGAGLQTPVLVAPPRRATGRKTAPLEGEERERRAHGGMELGPAPLPAAEGPRRGAHGARSRRGCHVGGGTCGWETRRGLCVRGSTGLGIRPWLFTLACLESGDE